MGFRLFWTWKPKTAGRFTATKEKQPEITGAYSRFLVDRSVCICPHVLRICSQAVYANRPPHGSHGGPVRTPHGVFVRDRCFIRIRGGCGCEPEQSKDNGPFSRIAALLSSLLFPSAAKYCRQPLVNDCAMRLSKTWNIIRFGHVHPSVSTPLEETS